MQENKERDAVIQNLEDAGCSPQFVGDFLSCYDKKESGKAIKLLEEWRDELLHQVHVGEKRISCLDYLLYQIKRTGG